MSKFTPGQTQGRGCISHDLWGGKPLHVCFSSGQNICLRLWGGKRHNLSFCIFASAPPPPTSTQQHASREGDDLTQADRERLAELLQEIDREEEDGAKGADSEVG